MKLEKGLSGLKGQMIQGTYTYNTVLANIQDEAVLYPVEKSYQVLWVRHSELAVSQTG